MIRLLANALLPIYFGLLFVAISRHQLLGQSRIVAVLAIVYLATWS